MAPKPEYAHIWDTLLPCSLLTIDQDLSQLLGEEQTHKSRSNIIANPELAIVSNKNSQNNYIPQSQVVKAHAKPSGTPISCKNFEGPSSSDNL